MSSLNELTRLLQRWFAEHGIAPDGFTLILNFAEPDPAIRLDCAVRHEIDQFSFVQPVASKLDLRAFKMNGVSIRVESPIHEPIGAP